VLSAAAPRRSPLSLAIVQFATGRGADAISYLSEGIADGMAQRIARAVPAIDVAGRGVQRRASADDAAALRAANAEWGTRFLVTGNITGSRQGNRVLVALYDGGASKRVWQHTYDFDSLGSLAIIRSASREVALRVAGSLDDHQQEVLAEAPTKSRTAFEAALRGDAAMSGAAYERAGNAYRHAVQLDRTYADAYAKLALADAALVAEGVEKATNGIALLKEMRSAAAQAVNADPKSARAWLAEGRARLLDGRPTDAWRQAFDRAVSLSPKDPAVLEAYGIALAETDDRAAAREMLRRSAAIVSHRVEVITTLADLAVADKNDAEACELLNQAIKEDAMYGPAWASRALLRSRHDDLRFAWADAETAKQVGSALLGESAAAIVDLKARDTAHARLRLADAWADVQSQGTISVREGRALASALIQAGQMSRALDVLEAVRPRGPLYAATLRDPIFDRARREPRFRALVSPPAGSPQARVQGGAVEQGSASTSSRPVAPEAP
jgi:TolB-like protein